MHDQSEFHCDPFQDRPAEKGGQEWVELEACAPLRLRETFFPAHWWCQQSSFVPSRVFVCLQTSCTVRRTGPQKGLETRRKYTRIHLYPYCCTVFYIRVLPVTQYQKFAYCTARARVHDDRILRFPGRVRSRCCISRPVTTISRLPVARAPVCRRRFRATFEY